MKRWYVVNTLANQEARADLNLRRQGYQSWLPAMSRLRRHARRIDNVRAPLFPGYLFVSLDIEQEAWSSINGTFGVRRLLCLRDLPAPLPSAFVDALKSSVGADCLVTGFEPSLRPGQKVRIMAGPFLDCIATLVSFASKDRIAVLLDMLGREVTTVVSRRGVTPAT